MSSVFIQRVVLKQYKSIKHCDVRLGLLTILVGANGAGKSNFVDALCFVRDLRESLDFAFRDRSGILAKSGVGPADIRPILVSGSTYRWASRTGIKR